MARARDRSVILALLLACVASQDTVTLPGSGYMVFGPVTAGGAYSYDFEVTDGVNVDVFLLDETAYNNYRNAVDTLGSFDTTQAGVRDSHINTRRAQDTVLSGGFGSTYIVLDNTHVATTTVFSSTTVSYTVTGFTLGNGAFYSESDDSNVAVRFGGVGVCFMLLAFSVFVRL